MLILALAILVFRVGYGACAPTINEERLLRRLIDIKPFQTAGPGHAFAIAKEGFAASLAFFPPERRDQVMDGFEMAVAFQFGERGHFLVVSAWRDEQTARLFAEGEGEAWRERDEEYRKHIRGVEYRDIEVAKGERGFWIKKRIEQEGETREVTTLLATRGVWSIECTLMGGYEEREIKSLLQQIWKAIEGETKRGR